MTQPEPRPTALPSFFRATSLATIVAATLAACGGPAPSPSRGDRTEAVDVTRAALFGPTLPTGWNKIQIGTTTATSVAQYDPGNGHFQIDGAGALPGSYEFVYRSLAGDGEIIAEVLDVGGGANARAGIAVKSQLNAASSLVALLAPAGGLYINQLTKVGNAAATEARVGANYWVKIVRRGNVVSTYAPDNDAFNWRLLGQVTLPDLGAACYYGLVVASGSGAATARASIVTVGVSAVNPFTSKDLRPGTTGATGSTTYDATYGSWTIRGDGPGMVGTNDTLRFAYRKMTGNGSFSALFDPPNGVSAGAQAGILVRTSLNANAAGAFISMDNSDREWLTVRKTNGAAATSTQFTTGAFGGWMLLERFGDVVYLYSAVDGSRDWDLLGTWNVPPSTPTLYVGLADTSGVSGQLGVGRATNQTLWTDTVQ